jgi:hypothetical protein
MRILVLLIAMITAAWPQEVGVLVDAAAAKEPMEIGRYGLGQGGLSDDPMFEMHREDIRSLKVRMIRLFIQEYFNVYPNHGVYNWKVLDRSVDNIRQTGAQPLMSICIKPRVLYPVIDETKVDPSSYAEWERLIYQMVRHYNVEKKYGIKYWEVFNEPDIGERGGSPSLFNAENYCRYYEHTARAILRADPTVKVGGPALANYSHPILKALLAHVAEKHVPLHFVSWHMYNRDPLEFRRSIESVKSLLNQFPTLDCETMLDEWNMSVRGVPPPAAYQPAYTIDTIYQMRQAGLDYAAHYHIRDYHVSREQFAGFMSRKGALHMEEYWNLRPRYYGIYDYQGIMRPLYFAFKLLSRLSGSRLEAQSDRPAEVKLMASYDEDQEMIQALVWNFTAAMPKNHRVNLAINNLGGKRWAVRRILLDAETASNQENDRLRVVRDETLEAVDVFKDSFDLPGYGVTLISLKKLE